MAGAVVVPRRPVRAVIDLDQNLAFGSFELKLLQVAGDRAAWQAALSERMLDLGSWRGVAG